ncbi:hypothetical protein AAG570_006565 [Ranatra chinensis]|uniref:Reverse transcriptase domain-containing protein n=1 Tax=Ranatra chinensis TaxID=642074 RepID=A0ABD0ZFM9_9HEMI
MTSKRRNVCTEPGAISRGTRTLSSFAGCYARIPQNIYRVTDIQYGQSLKLRVASKRNMFYENKKQETTEIVTYYLPLFCDYQISFALEKKEYCGGVFLDVAQAFDRVWHPGLLFKLKRILPSTYYLILQSYLTNRYSVVCLGEKLSGYIQIKASVPQGSVLGPLLYLVYTADIPTQTSTSMATFADDISKKSNIDKIQSFQSKTLRTILDAPWYVSNRTIHNDLNIPTVYKVAQTRFRSFHTNLEAHPNPLISALSSHTHPLNPPRRLKRRWPRDLLGE